jgi:hypothetical protein
MPPIEWEQWWNKSSVATSRVRQSVDVAGRPRPEGVTLLHMVPTTGAVRRSSEAINMSGIGDAMN